ncbi:MAG TPA: peptidoglycan-binding domain-containing protein [Pyrinomonadaceae bacterium]|nr:peptidoglycan-binding domain-containing protein [Pyrinomonadaceae bacterium]
MKSLHFFPLVFLLSVAALSAQGQTSTTAEPASESRTSAKRGPVFRANKEQVSAAQRMLKTKGIYAGETTGKLDDPTRDSIKTYQQNNGLRSTGTLNRATLEKMGISLTDKQKEVPVSANSYASAKKSKSGGGAPGDEKAKRNIFRATKDQIIEAQKLLRTGGLYSGEETGKLDDTTRESLRKYQEAKGLKATGTLNQSTLEKMGIALTEKQKGAD